MADETSTKKNRGAAKLPPLDPHGEVPVGDIGEAISEGKGPNSGERVPTMLFNVKIKKGLREALRILKKDPAWAGKT